ncbi:MAG: cadmium resistance transporter [Gammaproteobacteria bacterium]|jgi:cadmium resistance protein CadD (predicted permease)
MIAEVWAGLLLGIAGVVATNVDNFLVLVGVFGTRSGSRTAVRLGFCVGALILLVISLIFSFIGELIPIRFLGYLGVIPISMGVLELSRQDSSTARAQSRSGPASQGFTKSVVTVSILTLAGGTDTFAVIAPLLAESQSIAVAAICSGYVIAVIGIAALLGQAVSHPAFVNPLRRYGPKIGPVVMILIGIYILLNTATDSFPGP